MLLVELLDQYTTLYRVVMLLKCEQLEEEAEAKFERMAKAFSLLVVVVVAEWMVATLVSLLVGAEVGVGCMI